MINLIQSRKSQKSWFRPYYSYPIHLICRREFLIISKNFRFFRRVSGHTDTPSDKYVEVLIGQIRKTMPQKAEEVVRPKSRSTGKTGVDLFKGLNGKQAGGWRNIDDYFQ